MTLKVLQLCHKPPFPSIDGGCLEMAKMSSFFDDSIDYELEILSLHSQKHPFVSSAFKKELKQASYQSVFVNTKLNSWGALVSLLKWESYNLSRFKSTEFKEKLVYKLQNNSYDIIQLESIFVGNYIKYIKGNSKAKIVLNSPNIEYEIWQRLAKGTKNPIKKIYLSILAKQLKREEKKIYNLVDSIVSITKKDENVYKKIVPQKNIITIPFAIDLNSYQVNKTLMTNVSFFHIGSMNWEPNIEGMSWFVKNVWLKYFSSNKTVSFNIAGIDMPKEFFELSEKNMTTQGFVENSKNFIYNQNVMIVPLFSGSGLRVKIIEAMAMGKCVISTALGAEGINYSEDVNILIANNVSQFQDKINMLITNPKKIKKIGLEARKLVEKDFNKQLIIEKSDRFYKSLI